MTESRDPLQTAPPETRLEAAADPSAQPGPSQPDSPEAPGPHHHHQHGLIPALQSLFYIIVVAIFIITFTVQPFRIPSASMEPTLLVGDFLLVAKQNLGFDESTGILPPAAIHRGQIVIFHFPVDPSLHLIKRVVGLPGDHLRLHDNRVYINGQPRSESYAIYRPAGPDSFRDNFPRLQAASPDVDSAWWIHMHTLIDHGELIIPAGNYFVLGDNRNNSEDSRYWGFVPRANIVGTPILIYFSLQQTDEDDDLDDKLTPTVKPAPTRPTPHRHGLDAILHIARWGRLFHIVQ